VLALVMAVTSSCGDDAPDRITGNPTTWKILRWAAGSASAGVPGVGLAPPVVEQGDDKEANSLPEQREVLFRRLKAYFGYDDTTMAIVRVIFDKSAIAGQGNPLISEHPLSRSACLKIRREANLSYVDNPLCGKRNMVPIYDAAGGKSETDAPVCIDQYEFPNMPCEYPVVHVSALEAAMLCKAVGKRLCDAHEWEGACAGTLRRPEDEYAFGRSRKDMKAIHNNNRQRIWAYGPQKNHALCGTASRKSKDCPGGGYKQCGSNTYPAGAFPKCVSRLGVLDQHGNAAEHMNLPLAPEQLGSRGGSGETEMKGSWFIFDRDEAHDDDCHWRAPDWHATKLLSPSSHSNYHLGFRCCVDVKPAKSTSGEPG
jgi:hypothetical protein